MALKRIAVHGILTAVILAALGFLFAELAGTYMSVRSEARADVAEDATVVTQNLRTKLPFTMAAWGFALVVVGESFASVWRKPAPKPKDAAEEAARELRIQELLKQPIEAAKV